MTNAQINNNEHKEWYITEATGADFGDKRLTDRLASLLRNLGEHTEESIPASLDTWSETCAAYRFLSNDKVTSKKIFSPHTAATLKRIKQEKVVLLPQDTSEINYSSKRDIEGLGPLNSETHRGILLHAVVAVTPERVCLGSLSNDMWARESIGNKGLNRDRPIEEKESMRWLNGFEIADKTAKEAPGTLVVSIADREGDIYEFFQCTGGVRTDEGAHWLIRSQQNRIASKDEHGLGQKLWDVVRKQTTVAKITFQLPKRNDPSTRSVTQEIRFAMVQLGGVRRKGKGLPPLTVTAVLATEINVPKEVKPTEWLLISSLPVSNSEEAIRLLKWYLCRWEIELFFKVLKSGCNIEKLQLEHVDRLCKCITIYMIIAWRIMYIRSLWKKAPNQSCLVVFAMSEWQSVYCRLHKNKPPPHEPISLYDMVVLVARLGGFLARKGDGTPGIKTMWKGIQRMHDCAEGWNIAMKNKTYV